MKLKEAIERGRQAIGNNTNVYVLVNKEALELLIEAGKGIFQFRSGSDTRHLWQLPGETED